MKFEKITQDALHSSKNMTEAELTATIKSLEDRIERYKLTVVNYPPERMKKHGEPYLTYLKDKLATFVDELQSRQP